MYIKTLFLAAFAAFTLASCDKDEDKPAPSQAKTYKNVGMALKDGASPVLSEANITLTNVA